MADGNRPAPRRRTCNAAEAQLRERRTLTVQSSKPMTDTSDHAVRLAAALALIEREFRRHLTLSEIARAAHFSTFHFHRLFHRQYGNSPKQMIHALRVAEVQRLALAGVSFKDASDAVGFAHQSHMTTRFKKVVGMTPVQWLRPARSRESRTGDAENAMLSRAAVTAVRPSPAVPG